MMAFSRMLDAAQLTPVQAHDRTSRASNNKMQQFQQPLSKRSPKCPKAGCTRPHYAYPTTNSTARKRASKPFLTSHSSLSSSPSRSRFHRSPASAIHCSDVAAADPEHITELWKSVMSYVADTESSRAKKRATPSATESLTSASTLASTTQASSSSRVKKGLTAKVSDLDFDISVLAPYGITIETQTLTDSFYHHFGFSKLPQNRAERLNAYKKELSLNIWLEPNGERKEHIQREYNAMNGYGCNEAEYSTYALQNIFLDEPRYHGVQEIMDDEHWLPVRMLQLVQKPSPNQWEKPRLISSSNKQYEWDIRSDCAYYASLRAFPFIFRDSVEKYVSVVQDRAFSPYLTIEFKKSDEPVTTARNQVAVASAIALYNRWRLKRAALQIMDEDNWSEEQKLQLRHYGITFIGSKWELWFSSPKTYDDWTGCTMSSMHRGDCLKLASVGLLLSSINDIHYWGITVHARLCKADVDTIADGKTQDRSWLLEKDEQASRSTDKGDEAK